MVERRSPKPTGSMPALLPLKKMKFNPAKYLREVRQEVSKVTWSKKETFTSAGIVLIVISIAAVILMLVDQFFSFS